MERSEPSHLDTPHLIFDPVRKDALVIENDRVIVVPGPFSTYNEALSYFNRMRGDVDDASDPSCLTRP